MEFKKETFYTKYENFDQKWIGKKIKLLTFEDEVIIKTIIGHDKNNNPVIQNKDGVIFTLSSLDALMNYYVWEEDESPCGIMHEREIVTFTKRVSLSFSANVEDLNKKILGYNYNIGQKYNDNETINLNVEEFSNYLCSVVEESVRNFSLDENNIFKGKIRLDRIKELIGVDKNSKKSYN